MVVFLAVSSLEFPVVSFLVTYVKETLINKWDTRCTESSEGVLSLGWAGQEEESWRKIGILVVECQWAVRLAEL
jgi:hypothetical protein